MPRSAATDIRDVQLVWSCHSPPSRVKWLSHKRQVIGPEFRSNGGAGSARSESHVGRDAPAPEAVLRGMLRPAGPAMLGNVMSTVASRSASPTYTAIKIATMAAIASMNSVVFKPALVSVKVLPCTLLSARWLA